MPILPPDHSKQSGVLILVVGPSGSGKDSLIALAKEAFNQDARFIFPRRVITRAAMASAEDHDTMTGGQFESAKAQGAFALSWEAHGLAYGIRSDILDALRDNRRVIVNVSRSVIGAAEALGFHVMIISIICRPDLLAERIAARGRESKDDIVLRLKRDAPIRYRSAKLVEIRNETTLVEASTRFIQAIREA